jgi:hypothetical protein
MQVLLGAATLFFCCCRVAAFGSQDLDLRTWVSRPRYLALTTNDRKLTVADRRTQQATLYIRLGESPCSRTKVANRLSPPNHHSNVLKVIIIIGSKINK